MADTLILGSSGFVGSRIKALINSENASALTPNSTQLNLLEPVTIARYLDSNEVAACINFSGFTNLEEAELERGKKHGNAWKNNVEAVENLLEQTKRRDIFLVHISTDAVFPGTDKNPGPYSEDIRPPDDPDALSWYGYTKLKGEIMVLNAKNTAVVRIAYPFGNSDYERDFALRTLSYIQKGYTLFNDQQFTPTYIPDLYKALADISNGKLSGIYHVACNEITTPYKFGIELARNLNLKLPVNEGPVRDFLHKPNTVPRLINGGLTTESTQKSLGLNFTNCYDALDTFISQNEAKFYSILDK